MKRSNFQILFLHFKERSFMICVKNMGQKTVNLNMITKSNFLFGLKTLKLKMLKYLKTETTFQSLQYKQRMLERKKLQRLGNHQKQNNQKRKSINFKRKSKKVNDFKIYKMKKNEMTMKKKKLRLLNKKNKRQNLKRKKRLKKRLKKSWMMLFWSQ